MAFELDTTKLRQAGFRKTVSHDNCVVLDIGSGSFPRYIEVRPPGDDGSRMTAVWDGSLELAVNDKVIAIEYGGNPIWRIQSKGGSDSGAGSVRVDKIWESDFGDIALRSNDDGYISVNSASPAFQWEGASWNAQVLIETPNSATISSQAVSMISDTATTSAQLAILKARAGPAAVADGDSLGIVGFSGHDGTDYNGVANIEAIVDGTVSANTVPVKLQLSASETNSAALDVLLSLSPSIVEIGDVAGGGDVDIDFNDGQMFLRGSDGFLGVGTSSPAVNVQISGASKPSFMVTDTTNPCSTVIQSQNVEGFLGTITNHPLSFTTNQTRVMTLTPNTRRVGIGVTSPQGRMHTYDVISGFIVWEYDGLDATVRTIIPNATGDVLYRLTAMYVLRDSAAAVASGTTDVSNSASVNLTVGTNTVRLRVNADGSTDIARTAGTDTIKVALTLRWL
jgi:hypothetical protein